LSISGISGQIIYDLYMATQAVPSAQNAYYGRIGAVHPGLITRLQNECYNWGRYCFRSLRFHSEAVGPTNETTGYVAALTHDTSWPLDEDQVAGLTPNDIAQLGSHTSGAFYEDFDIRVDDFRGDRTWSTTLPVIDFIPGSGGVPSSMIWPYADASYQYVWALSQVVDNNSASGFRGYCYFTYEIDFYSVKNDDSRQMGAILWDGADFKAHPRGSKFIPRAPKQKVTYAQAIGRDDSKSLSSSLTISELKFIGRLRKEVDKQRAVEVKEKSKRSSSLERSRRDTQKGTKIEVVSEETELLKAAQQLSLDEGSSEATVEQTP
jgi:hypothetical protein